MKAENDNGICKATQKKRCKIWQLLKLISTKQLRKQMTEQWNSRNTQIYLFFFFIFFSFLFSDLSRSRSKKITVAKQNQTKQTKCRDMENQSREQNEREKCITLFDMTSAEKRREEKEMSCNVFSTHFPMSMNTVFMDRSLTSWTI